MLDASCMIAAMCCFVAIEAAIFLFSKYDISGEEEEKTIMKTLGATPLIVLSIISFLEERLYGKITLEEISHRFSFGKTYISKQFIKVCGHSIIDYFNLMKINEAKRLIRESSHNFFEISEMLMFSNSHYFSTIFKKHTGMTPRQYRLENAKKVQKENTP